MIFISKNNIIDGGCGIAAYANNFSNFKNIQWAQKIKDQQESTGICKRKSLEFFIYFIFHFEKG